MIELAELVEKVEKLENNRMYSYYIFFFTILLSFLILPPIIGVVFLIISLSTIKKKTTAYYRQIILHLVISMEKRKLKELFDYVPAGSTLLILKELLVSELRQFELDEKNEELVEKEMFE